MAKRESKSSGRPMSKHQGSKRQESVDLRIIGGKFRGSKLRYESFVQKGDRVTRPMKDRVREAIFNLIGLEAKGRHAIDLFAGTGALGLEALSRGATSATLIEKHVPTARVVEENIAALQVEDRTTLLMTSAFLWGKRDLPNAEFGVRSAELGKGEDSAFRTPHSTLPWLVFCSPPYAFYVDRQDDMLALINAVLEHAPAESILVVEADERFDFGLLPGGVIQKKHDRGWDVRIYPPAVVGIWRM